MSSASLAVPSRVHPDYIHIAALSAAIALNLAVLVVTTRPLVSVPFPQQHALDPIQQVRLIEAPAVVQPPPPIELKPLPLPQTPPMTPTRRLSPTPMAAPMVTPTSEGLVAMPPATLPTLAPSGDAVAPPVAAPVEASLAYRSAPLVFPPQALRQRLQGTVLLRVLVDETGKPTQVTVERSSGHALLDRSAREQVLASWLFQPALVQGKAVRAWARVPVNFELREM